MDSKGFVGVVFAGLSVDSTRQAIHRTLGKPIFGSEWWDHYQIDKRLNLSFLYDLDTGKLQTVNFGDHIFFSSEDNGTKISPISMSLLNPD